MRRLEEISRALADAALDGWLFYDFRKSNPIAYQVLGLSLDNFHSRRWYYFVPAEGTPSAMVSAVESHVLQGLEGERLVFRTWQELQSFLKTTLPQRSHVPFANTCSFASVVLQLGHQLAGALVR